MLCYIIACLTYKGILNKRKNNMTTQNTTLEPQNLASQAEELAAQIQELTRRAQELAAQTQESPVLAEAVASVSEELVIQDEIKNEELTTAVEAVIVQDDELSPNFDEIVTTAQGFSKLNLSEDILKALSDMGFSKPSGIQAAAIPQILSGIDIIAKAPTGSGKTAAFAIPILQQLDMSRNNKSVQALILCPTRELAIQVHREFEKLSKYQDGVSVVSVYGGQQIDKQLGALRKCPQVVVATPGRLMDHLRRGSIKLNDIKFVVLDEADEMLDMGFRDDIHTILEDTSDERQTVLFSATMAKDIVAITRKFQKSPNIVDVTDNLQNAPDIKQLYFEVVEKDKVELLTRLLDLHNVKLALVFCNTKSNVDKVVEILKTRGYFSDSLHGDMNQTQREKVMRGFRNGGIEILVATDVAGRGIDVKNIQAVFNYDLPRDDEDYIHRIGRTARAGESGTAFTFVSRSQVQSLRRIERANGVQIHKTEAPTYEELEATRVNTYETKIKNIIQADDLTDYINKVQAMVSDEMSLVKIAATLLKMSMNKESKKINKNVTFETSFGNDSDSRGGSRGGGRGGFRGGRSGGSRGGSRSGFSGGRDGGRDGGFGGGRSFDRDKNSSEGGRNRGFGERSGGRDGGFGGGRSFDRDKNNEGRSNDKFADRAPKSETPSLDEMINTARSFKKPGKSAFGGKSEFKSYGKKSGQKRDFKGYSPKK